MKKTYHKTEARRAFYKEMFDKLDGRCMICGEQLRLVIDHNHHTGELRGLLCYSHNAGLGMFQDSPELLEKAANYLRETGYSQPPEMVNFGGYPIVVDKRKISDAHIKLAITYLHTPGYPSERAMAKDLAKQLGITHDCAQKRLERLRKRLGLKVREVSQEVQNP